MLHEKKETAFICYIVGSLTGPILGVVLGGYVFSWIGGYTSPKALPVAILVSLAGGCCGMPVCFISNFKAVCALLWI